MVTINEAKTVNNLAFAHSDANIDNGILAENNARLEHRGHTKGAPISSNRALRHDCNTRNERIGTKCRSRLDDSVRTHLSTIVKPGIRAYDSARMKNNIGPETRGRMNGHALLGKFGCTLLTNDFQGRGPRNHRCDRSS